MASDIEKELKEEEREIKSEKQERIEMQMEAPARPVRWDKIAKAGLLIIVVGALFLYIGYRYGKESVEQPATPVAIEATVVSSPAASNTATTDPTANWKTYSNDTYGFSFKYPSEWNITNDNPGGVKQSVNQNVTISGTDSESLKVWVNPDGFGFEGASDLYQGTIKDNKLNITSKEARKPDADFPELTPQAVLATLAGESTNQFAIAYNFAMENRVSELAKFDEILSTFQFTK